MVDDGDDTEVIGGGYRRPWLLYSVVAVIVLAVVVGAVSQLAGPGAGPSTAAGPSASASAGPSSPPGPPRTGPTGWSAYPVPRRTDHPPIPGCSVDLPAPVLRGDRRGAGFEVWDCASVPYGPRAWVLRDADTGSFGWHGAVVTYPVEHPGELVTPGRRHGIRGWWSRREVVVRVGGGLARVRSDLGDDTLAAIARGLRVGRDGDLQVTAPAGLELVARNVWYRPPLLRGVRYGSADLGERTALGYGLTVVGVLDGARFEDRVYGGTRALGLAEAPMRTALRAGQVHGHPAVLSGVQGGNASLAWQRDDGDVVFVGYSGAALDQDARAALRRLAHRVALVDVQRWSHLVGQVESQQASGD